MKYYTLIEHDRWNGGEVIPHTNLTEIELISKIKKSCKEGTTNQLYEEWVEFSVELIIIEHSEIGSKIIDVEQFGFTFVGE